MPVCAEDATVTFKSADDVHFRIHLGNLKACTEGFVPPDIASFEDVVRLSEDALTLELLFQFIYPRPQPDLQSLQSLEFDVVAALAEAAEKYQVYPAMSRCRWFMLYVGLRDLSLNSVRNIDIQRYASATCPQN